MFRIITGLAVVALGIWFVYLAITTERIFFLHALLVSGIGVSILLNRHEDEIEKIHYDQQPK